MSRSPRADDLYALRVPTDVRISPDGTRVVFVVKEPNPDKDGYRTSIWLADVGGANGDSGAEGHGQAAPAAPRRLTLGAGQDHSPRWSPDGRSLAFLSDRGAVLRKGGGGEEPRPTQPDPPGKEREDGTQVWLLPMDGGEATQLTRLPRGVGDLAWSPDGSRLCVVSASTSTQRKVTPRTAGDPPPGDARLIDRLQYMINGGG